MLRRRALIPLCFTFGVAVSLFKPPTDGDFDVDLTSAEAQVCRGQFQACGGFGGGCCPGLQCAPIGGGRNACRPFAQQPPAAPPANLCRNQFDGRGVCPPAQSAAQVCFGRQQTTTSDCGRCCDAGQNPNPPPPAATSCRAQFEGRGVCPPAQSAAQVCFGRRQTTTNDCGRCCDAGQNPNPPPPAANSCRAQFGGKGRCPPAQAAATACFGRRQTTTFDCGRCCESP